MIKMNKSFLYLFVFALFVACNKDNSNDPNAPEKVKLAVETGDSKLPYFMVKVNEVIQNEPKVGGNLKVYLNKLEAHDSPIGIEYRGSTSYRMSDKKSYGIESWNAAGADTPFQFLNFPIEEDYILMGDVFRAADNTIFDPTLMHHYLGYEFYRKMGHYAARTEYIDLEINGIYMGAYIFMEKLKRDKNRIDIKKLEPTDTSAEAITGGYILKIDKTAGGDSTAGQPLEYYNNNWGDDAKYNEAISFRSPYDIFKNPINFPAYGEPYHPQMYLETYFLYEYPKAADITTAQKQYIQKYLSDFETALISDDFASAQRTYTNYIDINSFVDFFIINEITGNVDGYRLSTYLHKDRGEKLKMGPIWDLNIGYNKQGRVPFNDWIANYNTYVQQDAWMVPFWWPRLLQDPVFKTALKSRWQELRAGSLSNAQVLGLVDSTSKYLQDNGAIRRNYQKWIGIPVDYPLAVSELRAYLDNRLRWMDQTIEAY